MDPDDPRQYREPNRTCFLPTCPHNDTKNPDKRFFNIRKELKKSWCDLVGRNCPQRVLYCCEDHINVEEDLENYKEYIYWSGARPKLKLNSTPKNIPKKVIKPTGKRKPSSSHYETSRDGAGGERDRSPVVVDESVVANAVDGSPVVDESARAADESAEDDESQVDEEVEIKVEAELEDENAVAQPDPLSCDVAETSEHVTSLQPGGDGPLQLETLVIKEEFEIDFDLPPELRIEEYKATLTKLREEIATLKTANLKLTYENETLNSMNQHLTKRIENYLQSNEKLDVDYESILNNIKIDNHSLTGQHLSLNKNINILRIENGKDLNRIQELLENNKVLTSRILDINDRNKCLTDKINELITKENEVNKRKVEEINVFVQKIHILSEDVRRLTEENKLLEEKIRELEGNREAEIVDVKRSTKKERFKRKRKRMA